MISAGYAEESEDKMYPKRKRTGDVYYKAGAELRLAKTLFKKMSADLNKILSAKEMLKFDRVQILLNELSESAMERMCLDYDGIKKVHLGIFYGDTNSEAKNSLDETIINKARETADELFKDSGKNG